MKFPKLKRPSYKRMYGVMKENLTPYFSRSILAVLIIDVIKYFLAATGVIPTMNVLMNSNATAGLILGSSVFSVILSLGMRIVTEAICFGVIMYFTNIIINKKGSFGDIFKSISDYKSKTWIVAGLYTIASVISTIVIFAVVYFNAEFFAFNPGENFTPETMYSVMQSYLPKMLIIVSIYIVITHALKLIFVFVPNVIRDTPSIGTGAAFTRAFALIFRNYFHFIGFNFYTCLKNLIILLVVNIILFVLPSNVLEKVPAILMLFNFVTFMEQYSILAKINASIPIYYYSILSVNGLIKTEYKAAPETEILDAEVIEHNTDSSDGEESSEEK